MRVGLPCQAAPSSQATSRSAAGGSLSPLARTASKKFRLLGFGEGVARRREVVRAVQPEAVGQRGTGHGANFPAEQRGGVGQGADGVADVELAVAEGAFAIFPCFAPHDAGQPDGEPWWFASAKRRQGTAFQRVRFRLVVMQAVRHAGQTRGHDVDLDRMQVAGGWIAAQCPAAGAPAFPGRDAEGQFEQGAQAVEIGGRPGFQAFRAVDRSSARNGRRPAAVRAPGRRDNGGRAPAGRPSRAGRDLRRRRRNGAWCGRDRRGRCLRRGLVGYPTLCAASEVDTGETASPMPGSAHFPPGGVAELVDEKIHHRAHLGRQVAAARVGSVQRHRLDVVPFGEDGNQGTAA